ncbi:MAG: ATP-binding cassette domain-containing protein [Acidobacteriota bacterium]
MTPPRLRLRDFHVRYRSVDGGAPVAAVRTVDFELGDGESVGLFGASGCGKSSLAFGAFRLLPPAGEATGEVYFDGERIDDKDAKRRSLLGRDVGFVFQQPSQALHPLRSVGGQLLDVLRTHTALGRAGRRARARELFEELELEAGHLDARPHQLSGGQQQRALLAVALAGDPSLLVADEPTSALDSETEASLLRLVASVRRRRRLTLLWISHDPNVLEALCTRIAVMADGRIVEAGTPVEVFGAPRHAATRRLLAHRVTGSTAEEASAAGDGGVGGVGRIEAGVDPGIDP